MIVDVDDRRWETLLFEGRDHRFDVSPHSVRRPVFALAPKPTAKAHQEPGTLTWPGPDS